MRSEDATSWIPGQLVLGISNLEQMFDGVVGTGLLYILSNGNVSSEWNDPFLSQAEPQGRPDKGFT